MKKNLFYLLCVLTTYTAQAAQEISCSQPLYQFGTKKESETLNHTFEIQNIGDKVLKLGKVRACCGATVKVGKKELQPGEKLPVSFEMKLKGRKGVQDKNIFIASDDPKTPYLNLKIKGNVLRFFKISERFIRLKDLETDSKVSQEVTIIPELEFPFNIIQAKSSSDKFSVDYKLMKEMVKTDKGKSLEQEVYKVTISNSKPFDVGRVSTSVILTTDNDKFPEIKIYLSGRVQSSLSITPKEIVVKKSEKKLKRFVAIRSKGKEFKLTDLSIPLGVSVEKRCKKAGNWVCTLQIDTKQLKGDSQLKFKSDYPGMSEIVVPIKLKL